MMCLRTVLYEPTYECVCLKFLYVGIFQPGLKEANVHWRYKKGCVARNFFLPCRCTYFEGTQKNQAKWLYFIAQQKKL